MWPGLKCMSITPGASRVAGLTAGLGGVPQEVAPLSGWHNGDVACCALVTSGWRLLMSSGVPPRVRVCTAWPSDCRQVQW